MKTVFPFTFTIDGDSFEIELHDTNKKEAKSIISAQKKIMEPGETLDKLNKEVAELKELKEIKREIASSQVGDKKAETLTECIELIEDIKAKKAKIQKVEKEMIDLDSFFKKIFDTTIKGQDASKLKKAIDDKGIPFKTILDAIGDVAKKEREKK